ncbi:MAG: SDR family oxidoreductase [Actinobacteria bacterium]|nr:SDR family oxidoreductase [Actinomycetota bacterium]
MPTVLVTGGTGLVGSAVVDALRPLPVLSLTRHGALGWSGAPERAARSVSALLPADSGHVVRAREDLDVEHVRGDMTQPLLGLSATDYARLAERVDVVIHAAGVTDYTTPRAATEALNVNGTRGVARFAEHAGAPLYHVSTGYVRAPGTAVRGRFGAQVYLDSKRAAELVAQECTMLAAIVRPSLVLGHSADGSTPSFQGLHYLLGLMLRNELPLLPFSPETRIDFLPRDLVGAVIARLALERFEGEHWLTAGADAPTFGRAVELSRAFAAGCGRQLDPPRFISHEMIDRLLRPIGGPALVRRLELLLALSSHLRADPLPCSRERQDDLDLEAVLWRSTAYWAERTGWARTRDPVPA